MFFFWLIVGAVLLTAAIANAVNVQVTREQIYPHSTREYPP